MIRIKQFCKTILFFSNFVLFGWSRTQINHDPVDLCNAITMVLLRVRQTRGRMGRREILLIPALICKFLHTTPPPPISAIRQSGPFQILQSQCALCACAVIRACSHPGGLTPGCRPGIGCRHLIGRSRTFCQARAHLSISLGNIFKSV